MIGIAPSSQMRDSTLFGPDYLAALEKSVGEVLPSAVAGECRAAEPDSPRGENA